MTEEKPNGNTFFIQKKKIFQEETSDSHIIALMAFLYRVSRSKDQYGIKDKWTCSKNNLGGFTFSHNLCCTKQC